MAFEISKYALMDRVLEKKEIEDAIAAANGDGDADLGSYNSVEHLILTGGTVALDPEIHTSWLDTSSNGPTTITLVGPLPFSIGLLKLIFMQTFESPGDDVTLDTSAIRSNDGGVIDNMIFARGGAWMLLESWDTDVWRIERSSDDFIE